MDVDRSVAALSEVLFTLAIFAVGVAILEGSPLPGPRALAEGASWRSRSCSIAPALVGLPALIIYPLVWELNVSFTNMSLNRLCDPGFPAGLLAECRGEPMFVGLDNYVNVFTRPVLQVAGLLPGLLADDPVDRHQRGLPRRPRPRPRPPPQPPSAAEGRLPRAHRPAVGDPADRVAGRLADRAQRRVRHGQPAARPWSASTDRAG